MLDDGIVRGKDAKIIMEECKELPSKTSIEKGKKFKKYYDGFVSLDKEAEGKLIDILENSEPIVVKDVEIEKRLEEGRELLNNLFAWGKETQIIIDQKGLTREKKEILRSVMGSIELPREECGMFKKLYNKVFPRKMLIEKSDKVIVDIIKVENTLDNINKTMDDINKTMKE